MRLIIAIIKSSYPFGHQSVYHICHDTKWQRIFWFRWFTIGIEY